MDYRITDAVADLPGSESYHSEKLLRIAPCFLCYSPPANAPEIVVLPAKKNSYITFGCFNTWAKINKETLGWWAELLAAIPDSQLMMKNAAMFCPQVQQQCLKFFEGKGIANNRLQLICPVVATSDHLAYYNKIDIALDSYPYHGTTTSCEALYMGVPVLTLAGDLHMSRVGVSLLTTLGLQDWIALDSEDYIQKAMTFAGDLAGLNAVRQHLRQQMLASPLCDGEGFSKKLAAVYRQCWVDYADGFRDN